VYRRQLHRFHRQPDLTRYVHARVRPKLPSHHLIDLTGEIAAINNCTNVLTDPAGPYHLTPSEAQHAFTTLSLYTNAESCPMCASAIRWTGFKEYIYGTSIDSLIAKGWAQIRISSMDVFQQAFDLDSATRLMGDVLTNETDPYFFWQFDPDYPCPTGCQRSGGRCEAVV
jgi:tRNA(Arg) A34 adenosine deaminase TadA